MSSAQLFAFIISLIMGAFIAWAFIRTALTTDGKTLYKLFFEDHPYDGEEDMTISEAKKMMNKISKPFLVNAELKWKGDRKLSGEHLGLSQNQSFEVCHTIKCNKFKLYLLQVSYGVDDANGVHTFEEFQLAACFSEKEIDAGYGTSFNKYLRHKEIQIRGIDERWVNSSVVVFDSGIGFVRIRQKINYEQVKGLIRVLNR